MGARLVSTIEANAPRVRRASTLRRSRPGAARHLPAVQVPLRLRLIAGGHSNLTYRIEDERGAFRIAPPATRKASLAARTMWRGSGAFRGARVLRVPVPRSRSAVRGPVRSSARRSMSCTGSMARRRSRLRSLSALPTAMRARAAQSAVEGLVALHRLDVDAIGLGDPGAARRLPDASVRAHARRMGKNQDARTAAHRSLHARLVGARPPQRHTGLVHSDYRLGNLMLAPRRVVAVLDWELCALGDVLVDVGFLSNWDGPKIRARCVDAASADTCGRFPGARENLARYAEHSGFDVSRSGLLPRLLLLAHLRSSPRA